MKVPQRCVCEAFQINWLEVSVCSSAVLLKQYRVDVALSSNTTYIYASTASLLMWACFAKGLTVCVLMPGKHCMPQQAHSTV